MSCSLLCSPPPVHLPTANTGHLLSTSADLSEATVSLKFACIRGKWGIELDSSHLITLLKAASLRRADWISSGDQAESSLQLYCITTGSSIRGFWETTQLTWYARETISICVVSSWSVHHYVVVLGELLQPTSDLSYCFFKPVTP